MAQIVPIGDHPKLRKMCRLLDINRPLAVGLLHYFWRECAKTRSIGPDGKLPSCWDAELIASAAYWNREPSVFLEALIKCEFVDRSNDGELSAHNYYDRAPRPVQKRWATRVNRERVRLGDTVTEKRAARNGTVRKKSSGKRSRSHGAGVRDSFKKVIQEQAAAIYAEYPRKVGRGAALTSIIKAIGKLSFEELLVKTQAFANSREVHEKIQANEENFIPHPATWFNQERWLDEAKKRPVNLLLVTGEDA